MLASLSCQPSCLFSCSDHHLEVLSLPRVCNVNHSVSFQAQESVVDGSDISAVIVISTVWFDHNQRNLILLNKDAFGFLSLISRKFFKLVLIGLLLFLLLLLLLFFLALLLDSLLGGGRVLLDQALSSQFLNYWRDKLIVVAFSVFLNCNIEPSVNNLKVFSWHIADHIPSLNASLIISLQLHHCLLGYLLEDGISIKFVSCLLVVGIKVPHIGHLGFIVWIGLSHIGNQHTKLSPPVPHMVSSRNVMPHKLKNSANRLSNDGASEVAHVHFLRNVGRREVNHNLLPLDLREC